MPLYLDELWLDWSSPEAGRQALERLLPMAEPGFPWPPGVTLVAGPWFSNEERKIVLVLDIVDHAATFPAFGMTLVHGLFARRRLSPIVGWSAVRDLVGMLTSPGT